jgi:hypothetical protein
MKSIFRHPFRAVLSGGLLAIIATSSVYAQAAEEGPKVLPLSAVFRKENDLRKFVPVEHSISLPLPTLRYHAPGFASFASAAVRVPGQPMEQGVPDCWWVLDAKTGEPLLYALTEAVQFSEDKTWKPVVVQSPFRTVTEMQQARQEIVQLLDELAPLFFANQQAPVEKRTALLEALRKYVSPELIPQYKALVPDFFVWLGE